MTLVVVTNDLTSLYDSILQFDINEVRRQSGVLEMELLDQVNRGHINKLLEIVSGRQQLIADLKQHVLHQLPAR